MASINYHHGLWRTLEQVNSQSTHKNPEMRLSFAPLGVNGIQTPPAGISTLMEAEVQLERGICFISFDGAGPGAISQLRMIEEFMARLAFQLDKDTDELCPADYFDMMGGVGFGGFAALLLGRLHMTAYQAMEALSTIAEAIFSKVPEEVKTHEANTNKLQEAIEEMLQRHSFPTKLRLREDSDPKCKVVVFAASVSSATHCLPFRTYRSPTRSLDCSFVEAASAIMAVPEFFSPVPIGSRFREQRFAGIPYGFNNPMREMLKEALLVYGEKQPVSLVLSLGSGQGPVISVSNDHMTLLAHIVRDCDTVAQELSDQLSNTAAYLRLNVDRGMEFITISDWDKLGAILSHTDVYLQVSRVRTYIDEASQWLVQRPGSIILGQLADGTSNAVKARSDVQRLDHYLAMEVKQMRDVLRLQGMEKLTLVDAIGNRIPIPMELCRTYDMIKGIISLYYRYQHPPGGEFVERGDYRLVAGEDKITIEPASWSHAIKPGHTVEMSMVLRKRNETQTRCPRPGCNASFTGRATNGWAKCLRCSGLFQVESQNVEDTELVSPAVQSEGTAKDVNKTEEGRQSNVDNENREARIMEMSAQEKFRLISVINLLDSKGTIDISGEWNAVEIGISHRSGNTNTRGTYLFRMITPTTFIGLGAETDTYPSGNQLSYTFTATNGVVGDNRAISWLCDCAETQWKWRVEAKLAEDGMVMSGRMIGVSGGALDGPGVYTRVR